MNRNILFVIVLVDCLAVSVGWGDELNGTHKEIGFSRDVLPLLSKLNCNTSECHGALEGTGNLRLSPLGSDPVRDYHALAKEAGGRRVSLFHPQESLLLRRLASSASTVQIRPNSTPYRILRDWIGQGAVGPDDGEPTLVRLEASPSETRLLKGETVDIEVRATWSDGLVRDVSQWATYESDRERLAKVDTKGHVSAIEPGLATLRVSFLDQTVAIRILIPLNDVTSSFAWTPNNLVDQAVADTWKTVGVQPAEVSSDATFCRRVYLHIIGMPPTAQQGRAFTACDQPDKRQRLIDQLLADPRSAERWADVWTNWLLEDRWVTYGGGDWRVVLRVPQQPGDRERLSSWLQRALQQDQPIDAMVHDVLTATGSTADNGAAVFGAVHATQDDLARAAARTFLGVKMACARCHDHPHAPWDATDFANLAACFAESPAAGRDEVSHPCPPELSVPASSPTLRTFTKPNAAFLKSGLAKAAQSPHRRAALAAWITDASRRLLARNVVNRYWTELFGSSLAGPPDDLHFANPGSHPELLDALTRDFLQRGCNVEQLLRTLCNSRLYQLDNTPQPESQDDHTFFSRFHPQRLHGSQLRRTLEVATQVRIEKFSDPTISNLPPLQEDPVKCSRNLYRPGIPAYVTHLRSGNLLELLVKNPQSLPSRLARSDESEDAIVAAACLAVVCRLPKDAERQLMKRHFKDVGRQKAIEDLFWALINTKEFLFNH